MMVRHGCIGCVICRGCGWPKRGTIGVSDEDVRGGRAVVYSCTRVTGVVNGHNDEVVVSSSTEW
jgi:hypothetical protein